MPKVGDARTVKIREVIYLIMHRYIKILILMAACLPVLTLYGEPSLSDNGRVIVGEARFFSSLNDVPLMQGMEEVESRAISFDKPGGRISEAYAVIYDLKKIDILYFYQQTLPQLGWGQVSASKFFRQNEVIEFSFENVDGRNIVKVMIGPTL